MECNFNGMDISFSRSFVRGEESYTVQRRHVVCEISWHILSKFVVVTLPDEMITM
jgi:hypothetical protein